MSEQTLELARQWTEAYNARDYERLVEVIDPEFEMRSIFAAIDSGGVFRAPDGFPGGYFEALHDAYDNFQVIPKDVISSGSHVLMPATAEWRGGSSGVEGKTEIFVVFSFRSGKVLSEHTYTDRAEAFQAVGLSPG